MKKRAGPLARPKILENKSSLRIAGSGNAGGDDDAVREAPPLAGQLATAQDLGHYARLLSAADQRRPH